MDIIGRDVSLLTSGQAGRNARMRARNTASPRKVAQAKADRARKTARIVAEEKAAQRRRQSN